MHARAANFRISFAAVCLLGPRSFAATTTLAPRCICGLPSTIAVGCLERMFHGFLGPLIHQLELERRRIIKIRNPFLPVGTRSEKSRRSTKETEFRLRDQFDELQRWSSLSLDRERPIGQRRVELNALGRNRGEEFPYSNQEDSPPT